MNKLSMWCASGLVYWSLALGCVWGITIGRGPAIGTDKRGTTWYEEFQDWSTTHLKALDQNNDQYQFSDSYDNSRDLIAFYAAEDSDNIYFRVDFFDLAYQAEDNNVDVYVAIDCADGGESWLPDYSDSQTDMPWELIVCVYNSTMGLVKGAGEGHLTVSNAYLGSYWHSERNVSIKSGHFFIIKQSPRGWVWAG